MLSNLLSDALTSACSPIYIRRGQGQRFSIPNPSATSFSVDLNKDLEFGLFLESLDGSTKREISKYKGGASIDISQLKAGDYMLSITFEGKLVHKQRRALISKN